MAVNEWTIWKKLGWVKIEPLEQAKIKDDLSAVVTFLKEIDVKELVSKLEKMKTLVREENVIREELKGSNLKKQIEFFDEVLREYDLFQSDVEINGLRLKKIGQELLEKGKLTVADQLVKEKKKDLTWR